ncbi:MAG: UDP-N-acetylmuramate--L-alanine ligase [Actinobacteria bacterium]|nr:UDP-N-acetylmuramate--L-alanine ligase [Actinomycetota bacterium]
MTETLRAARAAAGEALPDYVPPPGSIATLEVPSLEGVRRLHLIGIGGAGMSGIAHLLMARGISVSGSDLKDSRALDDLRAAGAEVHVSHRAEQVGDPDGVVVSTAIPATNPELAAARERSLPVWARAQVLAALMEGRRGFAVSGTHGKTTTTSMLSVLLDRAGLEPSFVIGGSLNEIGSGARHGAGDVFVAEADESDGSFLLFHPDVAVVTNIEEDHLDFFTGGGREIRSAFVRFMSQAGSVVACGDDPGVRVALAAAGREALTYGTAEGNDVVLAPVEDGPLGARGTLRFGGGRPVDLALRVRGRHNLLNATAAVLAAKLAGVSAGDAARAVGEFSGVRRRFEYRGVVRGAEFYDDYAHHPTEVAATLAAAPSDGRRLIAVFQPHRYTRTLAMWRPMGESLAGADVVVVTDVYAAGEEPVPGVTGKLLVDALAEARPGKRLVYLPRRHDVVEFLAAEVRSGDLVLTLGAGDITMVAEETLDRLREEAG